MNQPFRSKLFAEKITEEEKEQLIKAFAASIRWKANYTENHTGDDESMVTISKCLEELAELQPEPEFALKRTD